MMNLHISIRSLRAADLLTDEARMEKTIEEQTLWDEMAGSLLPIPSGLKLIRTFGRTAMLASETIAPEDAGSASANGLTEADEGVDEVASC